MKTGIKRRNLFYAAAGLLILGLAAAQYLSSQSRTVPQHVFQLTDRVPFLTEELALAKAREALFREGLNIAIWQPQRDGRTTAPDGRADEFAARNTINSNQVVFAFTNGTSQKRFVSVELVGSNLICQSSVAK